MIYISPTHVELFSIICSQHEVVVVWEWVVSMFNMHSRRMEKEHPRERIEKLWIKNCEMAILGKRIKMENR